jgi:hypothetical protein
MVIFFLPKRPPDVDNDAALYRKKLCITLIENINKEQASIAVPEGNEQAQKCNSDAMGGATLTHSQRVTVQR